MAETTSKPSPSPQLNHQQELSSQHPQSAPAPVQEQEQAQTPTQLQLQSRAQSPCSIAKPAPASESASGPVPDPARTFSRNPPPLPYTLRTRKLSIAIFWIFFVCDTLVQPLVLYYCLWYLTNLSPNLVFTIVTLMLGGVSIIEYLYRFFQLFRKGSKVRPLNARRSWLDFFQINFTLVWLILAIELIVGTVQEIPPIRLLSMPLATVMYFFGIVHLSLDFLRAQGYKAPFRISSTPKGSVMPTALYVLVEDIVAVDGGGGQIYRRALRDRYLASPPFRQMLWEMNCFWGGGSIIFAVITTALVFTLPHDAAFAIGWSMPFVWAGISVCITIPWVQWRLHGENEAWKKFKFPTVDQNSEWSTVLGPAPFTDVVLTPQFALPLSRGSKLAKNSFIRYGPSSTSPSSPEKEKDLEKGTDPAPTTFPS